MRRRVEYDFSKDGGWVEEFADRVGHTRAGELLEESGNDLIEALMEMLWEKFNASEKNHD